MTNALTSSQRFEMPTASWPFDGSVRMPSEKLARIYELDMASGRLVTAWSVLTTPICHWRKANTAVVKQKCEKLMLALHFLATNKDVPADLYEVTSVQHWSLLPT